MEYFIGALKKFADFHGRARRKEYWMFMLIYLIFYVALAIVDELLGSIILTSIFSIVMLVPSVAIAARRLHDIGRTGWWQLIVFVPVIGIIVLLVFLVQDSHPENEYGISPKYA